MTTMHFFKKCTNGATGYIFQNLQQNALIGVVFWKKGARSCGNCSTVFNDLQCHDQCLNTFPVNPNKPGVFVKLAAKCIDFCFVDGGGPDHTTVV